MPESTICPLCAICGESVRIETAKADEHGQAVHEACYVIRIGSEVTVSALQRLSATSVCHEKTDRTRLSDWNYRP
jgi:hypothetical protein